MEKLSTWKIAVMVLVVVAIAAGSYAMAKGKPGGNGCPNQTLFCPDVWDPVICDNGVVYSNDCYARRACATGCVPYGDGGPVPVEF